LSISVKVKILVTEQSHPKLPSDLKEWRKIITLGKKLPRTIYRSEEEGAYLWLAPSKTSSQLYLTHISDDALNFLGGYLKEKGAFVPSNEKDLKELEDKIIGLHGYKSKFYLIAAYTILTMLDENVKHTLDGRALVFYHEPLEEMFEDALRGIERFVDKGVMAEYLELLEKDDKATAVREKKAIIDLSKMRDQLREEILFPSRECSPDEEADIGTFILLDRSFAYNTPSQPRMVSCFGEEEECSPLAYEQLVFGARDARGDSIRVTHLFSRVPATEDDDKYDVVIRSGERGLRRPVISLPIISPEDLGMDKIPEDLEVQFNITESGSIAIELDRVTARNLYYKICRNGYKIEN